MDLQSHITGIGGIFFKGEDAPALRDWYRQHLGIPIESWGGTSFHWLHSGNPELPGGTVWSIFDGKTSYFGNPGRQFMINYRVRDLDGLLQALRDAGVAVDDKVASEEYGRFGWATDPEGNRLEFWEPAEGY
ncbi:MAG: VOC family protein [Bacteroidia bacterium]|nr:VOC family protein [Bacteroidia bacterium]